MKKQKTDTLKNKPVNALKRSTGENVPRQDENPVTGLYAPLKRATGEIVPDLSDIDGLTDSIIDYIESWTVKHKLDDMRKADQPIFQACCMDIGKHFFKSTDVLRSRVLVDNGSCTKTTNNAYSLQAVESVLSIYSYIVSLYNKVFTVWGASAFCGVSDDFMYDHMGELTVSGSGLKQKAEYSLNDNITSGKRNPTGSICILNSKHGYSTGTAGTTERIKETVVIYPKLIDIKQPPKALTDVVEQ